LRHLGTEIKGCTEYRWGAYTVFGSKQYKYMMFGSQSDNKNDNLLVNN
jgi:hypothetical protein